MSDDSDHFEFSDQELDDKGHDKIVENVLKLNKVQHVKSPHRTEPTTQISEFNLVKSLSGNQNLVHLNELTKVLKGRKKHVEIANKVKSASGRSKTLPKPLEKPQAERIKRTLNYEKSRLQFDRWEALVTSNRAAPQLIFPLDHVEKLKIIEKKAEVYPSTFRLKSDLQKKLEALEPKDEEYHIETEEKDEFPLTLEELKEKRKEAAKLRAHQSYKEAKARRQNKIKSKKYHRILRREKIKEKLKEFELLQKTNPEEALKKLDDIEKARAEERFSLRHKGTGQWARNKQVRAKYDKESRKVLAQQLAISRELTQKVKPTDSESEDEGIESSNTTSPTSKQADENNPWVNGIKPDKDVTDFVGGYRKYWNEVNNVSNENNNLENVNNNEIKTIVTGCKVKKYQKKSDNKEVPKIVKTEKKLRKIKKNKSKDADTSQSTSDWEISSLQNELGSCIDVEDVFETLENKLNKKLNQKLKKIETNSKNRKGKKPTTKKTHEKNKIDLSLPSRNKKQVIDEEMSEQTKNTTEDDFNEDNSPDLVALKNILAVKEKSEEPVNINPNKFIQVRQTDLNTAIPDILTIDENEEEVNQRNLIMEAFEDDDIATDFDKEKAEEIEKDTPKDIDLNLPGWGSWAGTGIDSSKRKRKRFIVKMPPKMPRRDENKGSLIINEKAQAKIKPLLVSEIPFPFKSVKDYEASIRAPVGSTFVPETAFRKFIEPAVVTKMGAIIEPINKSILMGKKTKI